MLVSDLHGDLVLANHWLSQSQLLATVAIGQVTPGPVFTTATSIGYVVAGVPGALLATAGIFLPSFVLVAALMPLLSRARASKWSAAALDGVNAAALALMAGVSVQLATKSLVDWLTDPHRPMQPRGARAPTGQLDLARLGRRLCRTCTQLHLKRPVTEAPDWLTAVAA